MMTEDQIGDIQELISTDTKQTIVAMVASGYTYDSIARHLGLKRWTVVDHVKRMLKRSGARNQTHLICLAIEAGIISIEDIEGPT